MLSCYDSPVRWGNYPDPECSKCHGSGAIVEFKAGWSGNNVSHKSCNCTAYRRIVTCKRCVELENKVAALEKQLASTNAVSS